MLSANLPLSVSSVTTNVLPLIEKSYAISLCFKSLRQRYKINDNKRLNLKKIYIFVAYSNGRELERIKNY